MLEEAINSLPGDLRSRVGNALRQRVSLQLGQAFTDAKSIGAANNSKSYRHMDGLGEMRGSIPPTAYQYWEQREPGCWSDKEFVKKYLQDNPEVRVNTRSGKIQVGYRGNGFIPVGAGRRVKVYK
mgnify:FL=1